MRIPTHSRKSFSLLRLSLACLLVMVYLSVDQARAERGIMSFLLPLDEAMRIVDVGVMKRPAKEKVKFSDESASLLKASQHFDQANSLVNNTDGCFMFNKADQLIGYSLSSMSNSIDLVAPELNNIYEYIPAMRWPRTTYGAATKASVETLNGIINMKSLEFISFDAVQFRNGIWKDLEVMSHDGNLRGLSMINGDNFLDVRDGSVLPNIRGLCIHLRDADRLAEVGKAFPNLSFICVAFPDRNSVNSIFRKNLLRNSFPNLKALMLGDSLWPDSNVLKVDRGRDVAPQIRFSSDSINKEIEWIGIDGYMLANADMENYDVFAAELIYGKGGTILKRTECKNIQVVFMAFGFSARGARSMKVWEYAQLEKYWRSRPSVNPLSQLPQ